MVTTVAELSKTIVAMPPASFVAAHPAPALVLLFGPLSQVDSSLKGDVPEDGLLVTDIFFVSQELALAETAVGDPMHASSFSIRSGSPLFFLQTSGDAPEVRIGRNEGCDIWLPYTTVSAEHASLVKRGV